MVAFDAGAFILQVVTWLGIALSLALLAFLMGFGFVMIYRILRYRVRVTILDHVGDSHIAKMDLAMEVNEGGKTYLKFLKLREKIPAPNPDKYVPFGIRKLLMLHKHNDLYTPMPIAHNSPAAFQFNMDDLVSVLFWREQDHQEALDTYRAKVSFFERWQTPIIFGSFMIIQFVLFFVLFQKLGDLTIQVDTSQLVR